MNARVCAAVDPAPALLPLLPLLPLLLPLLPLLPGAADVTCRVYFKTYIYHINY